MPSDKGWIGFDLDGTLAEYHGWSDEIGKPVPKMVSIAREFIADGVPIRIVTARGTAGTEEHNAEQRLKIAAWCDAHLGTPVPITDHKDVHMVALYDDRAINVSRNEGYVNSYGSALEEDISALEKLARDSHSPGSAS